MFKEVFKPLLLAILIGLVLAVLFYMGLNFAYSFAEDDRQGVSIGISALFAFMSVQAASFVPFFFSGLSWKWRTLIAVPISMTPIVCSFGTSVVFIVTAICLCGLLVQYRRAREE